MQGACATLVGLVRSSNDTWSFGRSLGASLGGALATLRLSSDNTSFGGSAGGATTFCGKESKQLEVARLSEEDSKPGAS
jgi:hypothetical protein